jgi:hypothetical protein
MLARRHVLSMMLTAATLASCSTFDGGSARFPLPPDPPNMAVVSKAAIGVFATLKLPGSPELTALRPAHPSTLADWMMCLRSDADDIPREYALFVRNNAIVNYRLAVQLDGCAREKFESIAEQPR